MKIVLVRHGRSAHPHRGWYDCSGVEAWRRDYDLAGLRAGENPPPALRTLAANSGVLVSSDLPRAIESALLLDSRGPTAQSPLLRETPLLIPNLGTLRLHIHLWSVLIGWSWMFDRPRCAAEAYGRSAEAATWLVGLAEQHGSVVAITHGAFRFHLAEELRRREWSQPEKGQYSHWSAWELRRD